MRRGTTPTLIFTLPMEAKLLEYAYISFANQRGVIFEKQMQDCEANGNELKLRLTQADTLAMRADENVTIQIRAKTYAGDALASNFMHASVYGILKEGEI